VFLVVLWYLGDVILPFVLGGAIAYFLDPLADKLEASGCNRMVATVIIAVFGVLVFIVGFLLVVPTLISQAIALFEVMPTLFSNLQGWLTVYFPSLMDADSTLHVSLAQLGEKIQERGGELVSTLLSSALGVINLAILLVITPVVAVYLLYDWDRMIAAIDEMLPRDHAPAVRRLAAEVDRTLAAFIRGQGTVMLILGVFYAVALMLVGLNFGLVVGAVAGLLTFIPYVGAIVGGGLAIGLALFQFWGEWIWIGAVAAIFLAGQFLEGNVLTPKLVGGSVGLHPVWLLFALSVFGTLFGFVGMLVAVPVSAALGVLMRFGMEQYKKGLLYQGLEGMRQDADTRQDKD